MECHKITICEDKGVMGDMKLSLKLLHAELSVQYPGAKYCPTRDHAPRLTSSSTLASSVDPVDDVVYIHLPSIMSQRYDAQAAVITSETYASQFPYCDLIVLPADVELQEIPAYVASIFSKYFTWSDSLYDAIARRDDLQALIDLTVPMLRQPMYFADASWKMLAYWGGDMVYINPTWSYQMKFAYLPFNVYQGIIDADDMGTYRDRDDVVLCKKRPGFGETHIPFLSKAIRKEGKHYGNYFVIGLYHELDARDFEIAEHLGNIVATALYGDSNYLEASSLYSSHFIIDVIEGNLQSVSLMTDQLHALKWDYSGDFGLSIIALGEDDAALASHVMLLAKSAARDVNSFVYQGNVVSVFNGYSVQEERIEGRLGGLARDFNTVVAISNSFDSFKDVRAAYQQASFLLDYAQKESISTGLLKFTDHYLDYLAVSSDAVSPLRSTIVELRNHDSSHGTDYCYTLYRWLLLERNTVKTAEVLFVHRNTLKNRLVNIEKLIGLDLDDPSVRMQLLVGLHPLCRELQRKAKA